MMTMSMTESQGFEAAADSAVRELEGLAVRVGRQEVLDQGIQQVVFQSRSTTCKSL